MKWRSIVAAMALLAAVPTSAQTVAQSPALPTADDGDDIIVEALRIPREKLPVQVRWNYFTMLRARTSYERSEMFVRCAKKFVPIGSLRTIVDGRPNGAQARYALGRLVNASRSCYPGAGAFTLAPHLPDIGGSQFDRGAILEYVLRTYAPDAKLTMADMEDLTVRARFRKTESRRNALRFAADYDALVVSACLVRVEPVLATRLVRSDPRSDLERGLMQTMLVQGRACLGGTDRVVIDPTSFRIYVLDAFYRWVVAARGVPTLIVG